MKYDFSVLKNKGKETIFWLKNELASVRSGRATPALLDSITVESYGSRVPLKHISAISIENAKTLRVTPWDTGTLKSIESAIFASPLGLSPITDKNSIRLTIPELTDERKKILLKLVSEKLEDARIAGRKERDEVWKIIQEKERNGEIPEDDKFRFKEEMEKIIGELNAELESVAERKKEEISS